MYCDGPAPSERMAKRYGLGEVGAKMLDQEMTFRENTALLCGIAFMGIPSGLLISFIGTIPYLGVAIVAISCVCLVVAFARPKKPAGKLPSNANVMSEESLKRMSDLMAITSEYKGLAMYLGGVLKTAKEENTPDWMKYRDEVIAEAEEALTRLEARKFWISIWSDENKAEEKVCET